LNNIPSLFKTFLSTSRILVGRQNVPRVQAHILWLPRPPASGTKHYSFSVVYCSVLSNLSEKLKVFTQFKIYILKLFVFKLRQ